MWEITVHLTVHEGRPTKLSINCKRIKSAERTFRSNVTSFMQESHKTSDGHLITEHSSQPDRLSHPLRQRFMVLTCISCGSLLLSLCLTPSTTSPSDPWLPHTFLHDTSTLCPCKMKPWPEVCKYECHEIQQER